MGIILSTHNVTKRFGGLVAVNSFEIDVKENSISSVIGPNGAGKTTFFNCITGFYTPTEGEIIFDGAYHIEGLRPDKVALKGIARTYQNIRLFSKMTAIENILVGQHRHLKTHWVEAIVKSKRFISIVRTSF